MIPTPYGGRRRPRRHPYDPFRRDPFREELSPPPTYDDPIQPPQKLPYDSKTPNREEGVSKPKKKDLTDLL